MTEAPANPSPRPIAICHNYNQLRAAIAAFCAGQRITRAQLDAGAGLADGHSSKLLGGGAVRSFSRVTLGRVLDALELEIVLQVRAEAVLRAELQKHADENACDGKPARQDWRRNRGRAWGKRMAARRALLLTRGQRSAIARKAAAARWQTTKGSANPPANP
jgi:hypothetical protein